MARINLPGFALAVVKDGEVAYAKGFGVTSLDGGEPVTAQTVFQWNETAMSLTAMAVMQLVEEGKIDLNAPVTDYVPYFMLADERYKEITVGQVLAHTSGIPDSGDAMADWENFMPEYDGGALERWVRNDLAEKGLLFAPGTGWEYSDLAYALLGAVIGAASGQPYEEYMAEHIFAPLGMEKSTFLLEEVDKTLLANPHVPDAAGEVVVTEAMPYHRPFAATNNLFANVADMAKLALATLNRGALGDQSILPERAYDVMWAATSPTPFADFPFGQVYPANMMLDWGNGWFLGDIGGHPAPNTGGGEHGFLAQMFLVPDANLGVVAVGNSQAMDEYYAADMRDVLGMLRAGARTISKGRCRCCHRLVLSLSNVKWFAVLGLFVIAALLLSACQPIRAPAPTAQEYAHPEALASAEWLAAHLDDPTVRILDGRDPNTGGKPDYVAGHIPGAVYVNVWDDLVDPNGAVQGLILPKAEFEALMGRLGIDNDTTVVVI